MNLVYIINNLKAIPLMYQLGYKNNKKTGTGLAEEAIEVSLRHPEWITIIGQTDMDSDLLRANLQEEQPNLKILYLKSKGEVNE